MAGPIDVVDTMHGSSFPLIEAALAVVRAQIPDLAVHNIEVARTGRSNLIIFTEAGRPAAGGGAIVVQAETGVRLDPSTAQSMMSDPGIERLDVLQGRNFLAVEVAVGEFQRHQPELGQYKIEVVRDGDALVVIFADKNRPPGTRGSTVNHPGFEVEMSARDFRVRRAYFVR